MKNEKTLSLPTSTTTINVGTRTYHIIGTAHVSKQSVEDVHTVVKVVDPDTICVELCEPRYKSITQQGNWKKMDIFKIVREKKAGFLLTQLIMTSFYRRLGKQLDVKPGAEMVAGIELAKKSNKRLVLADRRLEITLKRVWGFLNFWNKIKMASQLLGGMLFSEEIDESMIEELKNSDQLENILETFAHEFPEVKKRLIDERDTYLAEKIRVAPGNIIVAIVGAGHVPGILAQIEKAHDLTPLEVIPPPSIVPKLIAWIIPVSIVALVVYGFFNGGSKSSIESVKIWILVNGIFSAIGAAVALAHPLTIIASFIAAPLTSLNPMIAAGWVSGLVQAIVKKPTVDDLEKLPEAITSAKGFWMNPVSRILLVVALANVGSMLGTFVAGALIAKQIF